VVADLTLENRLLKKSVMGDGEDANEVSASEKREIIQLVEQSHLSVRRALEQIGIPRSTFYRWYDLYRTGGREAVDDRSPRPDRVWNRIPDDVRARIVALALNEPEGTIGIFVCEAVFRHASTKRSLNITRRTAFSPRTTRAAAVSSRQPHSLELNIAALLRRRQMENDL